MVILKELTAGVKVITFRGDHEKLISSITFDSREVSSGSLFVAVRGSRNDGHKYIDAAIRSGASAIVCEVLPERPDPDVSWIVTDDSAKALGIFSSNFYKNPSSSLKLVGVTGTNGKTTIVTLLYETFTGLGYKCGLFSTICNYVADKELPATHTTPDPVQLNSIMAEMVNAGCEYAFMEVSSHARSAKDIGIEVCRAVLQILRTTILITTRLLIATWQQRRSSLIICRKIHSLL